MDERVGKFVNYDIINDFRWGQDQAPREIQDSFRTARAPARASGTDSNFLVVQVVLTGKQPHALGEDLSGLLPVPLLKYLFCLSLSPLRQLEVRVQHQGGSLSLHDLKRNLPAKIQKHLAGNILLGRRWNRSANLRLFFLDPVGILFNKLPNGFLGILSGARTISVPSCCMIKAMVLRLLRIIWLISMDILSLGFHPWVNFAVKKSSQVYRKSVRIANWIQRFVVDTSAGWHGFFVISLVDKWERLQKSLYGREPILSRIFVAAKSFNQLLVGLVKAAKERSKK